MHRNAHSLDTVLDAADEDGNTVNHLAQSISAAAQRSKFDATYVYESFPDLLPPVAEVPGTVFADHRGEAVDSTTVQIIPTC